MKFATLCYVKNHGETLMLHRIKKSNDHHRGKWVGLGGKIKPGESPEECVIREVREESGLNIIKPRLTGFLTFPSFDGIDDWYAFVFAATEFSGTLIDSPEGTLKWVTDEEMKQMNLWEGDYIFMEWINQKKFFSAKFIYENMQYLRHEVVFYSPVK